MGINSMLCLPLLSRYSTMSLNTRGIPRIICSFSRRVSKVTPNTELGGASGTDTTKGLTLAPGLRILTEEGSL